MTRTPNEDAIGRHPHLASERPPGTLRVDLHSHTMWSGDSTTTPEEIAEAVTASALDVLCVTDHNAIAGAVRLADELDCRVVVGEEVKTWAGEIIGLFLTERIPIGLQPVAVCEAIREQGGIVYIPHPFDPMRSCLREDVIDDLVARGLVDAMEARNGKTSLEHLNRRAAEYAAEHGLAAGGGSDAHVPEALGSVYAEMDDFDDAPSFLASLHRARVVGHHFDAPRRWRPRIVPSVKTI